MKAYKLTVFIAGILYCSALFSEPTTALTNSKSSAEEVTIANAPKNNQRPRLLSDRTASTELPSSMQGLKKKSVVDSLPLSYYLIIAILLSLVVVIAFRQRSKGLTSSTSSPFSIVAQLPLGMKESLQIIDIYGEKIVIARTANGIQKIHHIDKESTVNIPSATGTADVASDGKTVNSPQTVNQNPASELFSQLLQSMKVNN